MRPKKIVVNVETGETNEVELTDAEYADYLLRLEPNNELEA